MVRQVSARTSANTMSKIQEIFMFFKMNSNERWHSTIIAQKLGYNKNTVRDYCAKMFKKGLIDREKIDGMCWYSIRVHFPDDLKKYVKVNEIGLPYVHALQLHRKGISRQRGGLPIKRVFNHRFRVRSERRDTVIQWEYGRVHDSITIWVGCSNNPMDWDDLKLVLSELQGRTHVWIWEDLSDWVVCNYGINIDVAKLRELGTTIQLSIFGTWFAQLYSKVIEIEQLSGKKLKINIDRGEVHASMENAQTFIYAMSGRETVGQMLDRLNRVEHKLERLIDVLGQKFEGEK